MTSPEPGRSLAAHIVRLTEMMQAMDAEQKAYEEWLLSVDTQANDRIAACEEQIEAIRAESAQRFQAHRERMQVLEIQAAQHHETVRAVLNGLVQAQTDISRLDAAS